MGYENGVEWKTHRVLAEGTKYQQHESNTSPSKLARRSFHELPGVLTIFADGTTPFICPNS